eukprot:m.110380 g.110380  ORF g.110380 m.110380 type:complete len:170 (+) comp37393_c0_seq1:402-911(+)
MGGTGAEDVFYGLTAWFSSSSSPEATNLWLQSGGLISSGNKAEYLFSDDSSAADTIALYLSDEELTIFKTQWIFDVLTARSTYLVPLSAHILSPIMPERLRPQASLQKGDGSPVLACATGKGRKHEFVPGDSLDGIIHVDELDLNFNGQTLLEFTPNNGGCKVVVTKRY